MSEEYLFLPVENMEAKYQKLIWGGVLFLILGSLLVVAVFSYYLAHGSYDKTEPSISQILPIILFFLPSYGYTILRQGLSEKKLLYKAAMGGFLLDHHGLSGPIVLLEGPVRNVLRDAKEPIFRISWDEIEKFIVEPVRGKKKKQSPPYYKITLQGQGEGPNVSYFIIRAYFEEREEKILNHVALHLEAERIIMNDEISGKGIQSDEQHEV